MEMSARMKLLIADDQVLFAESLQYVLKGISEDIELVGIATDGEMAIDMAEAKHPDVILMDVRMPRMDGVEATKLIHRILPGIRIVMLTTFDDDEYVHFAVKHGAVGYLLKNMTPEDLVLSLRAVMRGATLFTKSVTEKIIRSQEGELGAQDDIMDGLTPRERDVLALVMRLMNNRQIADSLCISERSVRNYIHSLYDAFVVGDRMELIQKLKKTWPLAQP
jgi:DNA-binding NarL/FixJ family response regulator